MKITIEDNDPNFATVALWSCGQLISCASVYYGDEYAERVEDAALQMKDKFIAMNSEAWRQAKAMKRDLELKLNATEFGKRGA